MLIIPISGKIGWKNPPVVTLALLVINCLVFFLFQVNDDESRMAAEQFYLTSGLVEIEVPRYISYLEAAGKTTEKHRKNGDMDADALMKIHFEMEADADFLRHLMDDRIITPQDSDYIQWEMLRRSYEEKRNKSIAFAYGLRPAYPRASTFFTYMFLHGGVGHLVGNMVFLWILGCMLEIGSGRKLFVVIYLVSGFLSAGLFYVIYPLSTIPLVGASGAIAGLMGAYTVLYGRKKVNVFYSLGFYFNTAKIPAIVLLPVWLANECYQLFFSGVSHVAYVAHIGGLAGGAVLAFAGERFVGTVDRDSFEEASEDKVSPLMHQALEHMGNLEMRQAQVLFEEVLELSPNNHDALTHLFNIHKLNPESKAFHDAAKRLLRVLLTNNEDHQAALACYETYSSLARRPALSIPIYLQLAGIMATAGRIDGAEKIVLAILKKKPETPGLPSSLMKISQAFHKNGQMDRWKRYRGLVCKRYPDSVEAAIILRAAEKINHPI
ncbi:MAG: rhomboid family intramembrane serine protease [Desulfosarcina sp.]|nr:rhomboid family intramembrane serine protease [Desulfosarcina sp.]MBC2741749.1 rhomboid family intramembrane serine protease [Desulfosarcina sp.]MBC2764663.1 rhomboid family intramembrane serine protease [Desulfosarcina sp.]